MALFGCSLDSENVGNENDTGGTGGTGATGVVNDACQALDEAACSSSFDCVVVRGEVVVDGCPTDEIGFVGCTPQGACETDPFSTSICRVDGVPHLVGPFVCDLPPAVAQTCEPGPSPGACGSTGDTGSDAGDDTSTSAGVDACSLLDEAACAGDFSCAVVQGRIVVDGCPTDAVGYVACVPQSACETDEASICEVDGVPHLVGPNVCDLPPEIAQTCVPGPMPGDCEGGTGGSDTGGSGTGAVDAP